MARDNEPWVKVKIGVRRSGKLASLPSDSARLGYFYVLTEAKVQRHMGVFDNRAHFTEVLGRFGRWLPDYLRVGLVHEAPALCDECTKRNPRVKDAEIVVHDFQREQRDPTNAERQATYRETHRNGTSNSGGDAEVTSTVTGKVTPKSTHPVTPTVTADSRAPESTATVTVTTTGLTRPSTSRGARAEGPVDPVDEGEAVPWR